MKAYDVLAAVFKKFIQVEAKESKQEPAGPPPPPGFKEYKQSSGSGGVMGMLEQIMRDMESLKQAIMSADSGKGEVKSLITKSLFSPRAPAFTALINMCG